MGTAPDYSHEVAQGIDEEVRKLIEAAHTEAWEVLNTYRDVLDELVVELLDRETLQRKDLERIFSRVEKRPRITAFNDFGDRVPSDKPPIKTRGELAIERGEPWPPVQEEPEPTPVGAVGGANDLPKEANNGALPNGLPPSSSQYNPAPQPERYDPHAGRPSSGPPNYGAPPGWRPATSPQPDPDERDGQR
jgi:cell division protease FtsH